MLFSRRALLGSTFAAIFALPARADGVRVLSVRKTTLRLLPEPAEETGVCGFDGQVPGPLLRCKKGDALAIRVVNRIDAPLSFACQGMRLENAMDGVAGLTQAPIPPGGTFDYRVIPPDAGFFFYRSNVAPHGCEQLRQGLYGPFVVEEPDPPAADRDIVIVLADWQLNRAGQIAGAALSPPTDPPRTLTTANSSPVAVTQILPPLTRIRLRLLNAAASRILFVTFEKLKPMVLGIDGEPCEAFAPLQDTLPIGPGARFDVMFDLPAEAGTEARLVLRGAPAPDQPLLVLKCAGQSRPNLPPIVSLPSNPLLPVSINLKASRKLDLVIEGGATNPAAPPDPLRLNGLPAEEFGEKPLFSVRRGTPVSLGLVNKTAFVQQIHVHGHHVRVLHDLDDGWDPYWRDSVIVAAGRAKHVAFLADNPGKWAIECLPLYPQSSELVAWFGVA
ncbi:MAG: multicopper oxidase family protein [Methylovirgula sp.]